MPDFESLGAETVFSGQIFDVRRGRFRHADGAEVTREFVVHGGAVAVVAYDHEVVYLVRQPREAVGRSDLVEIPAGRLDVEGEAPLAAIQRELAEEIGKAAATWGHATTYFSSAGFTNERMSVYLATDLHDVPRPLVAEDERIEVVTWPLADLDAAIDAALDAKTLIGLLWLQRARRAG